MRHCTSSSPRHQTDTGVSASRTGAVSTATDSRIKSAPKPTRKSRAKKCRVCGAMFEPVRALQPTCTFECSVAYGLKVLAKNQEAKRKEAARAHREAKAQAKPRSQWMKEAQAAFNRWVRLRDADRPCISCGRHHEGQNHAGHFRSTGAAPELRFEESNVHLQCQPCNVHKSGNLIEYRKGLVERIGVASVEWLEGQHEPKKYTIDELKTIKSKYAAMAKELAK